MAITLTLKDNLYRRPSPTNEQPAKGYRPIGDTISVEQVVMGKTLEEISLWYRAADGYYWSGGLDRVDFVLPGLKFGALLPADQWAVCQQAMLHYEPLLRRDYPELTALSVSQKRSGTGQPQQPLYSVVFFVRQKQSNPTIHIPNQLIFKGFLIPTDVQEAPLAILCAPGEQITKPAPYQMQGTLGFVADGKPEAPGRFLVTNYHVLCDDRLVLKLRNLAATDVYEGRVVTHRGQLVGELDAGVFDGFMDGAKVRVQTDVTNRVADGSRLTGIKLRNEFLDFRAGSVRVRMVGAFSASHVVEGTIESLHAIVAVPSADHTFFDVIQLRLAATNGDSGSPVFTVPDNRLIGILAASDEVVFSYVIPISVLLKRLQLSDLLP